MLFHNSRKLLEPKKYDTCIIHVILFPTYSPFICPKFLIRVIIRAKQNMPNFHVAINNKSQLNTTF